MSEATEQPAVRVLVVDDEFVVRDFVSRILRQAGYQTETASDSGVALRIAEESPSLDLLVTDVKMPGASGADLARVLLRRNPHLKVLFLTGYADSLDQDRMTTSQQAILSKPCSIAQLLHAVSLILFGHIRGLEAAR